MKSSIQIQNQIVDLRDAIAADSKAFAKATGDDQAEIHDRIAANQGKVDVLTGMLTDALEEEDRIRNAGGLPLAAPAAKPERLDVADLYLGTRAEFDARANGIMDIYGQKVKFGMDAVRDAADDTHQFGLEMPSQKSYELPENIIEMPMGFVDTLAKGTTKTGLEYMVAGEFTNNAALWEPGTVKAESDESWSEDTANLFTVAHHMPISKQTAFHYGQLRSLISNDLMAGLKIKEAAFALNLDAGAGKKGVLKKGVQEYTPKKGEKFYDSLRRMINESWMKTGIRPNYVAVHPNVLVDLDLAKTSEGAYLALQVNGKLWGLPVVEDINLDTATTTGEGDSAVTTHAYGALVYNTSAATWYTSEADALTIGFVNDQFTRNEYTLLAEGEHLITVTRPLSFVHLADAITPGK